MQQPTQVALMDSVLRHHLKLVILHWASQIFLQWNLYLKLVNARSFQQDQLRNLNQLDQFQLVLMHLTQRQSLIPSTWSQ